MKARVFVSTNQYEKKILYAIQSIVQTNQIYLYEYFLITSLWWRVASGQRSPAGRNCLLLSCLTQSSCGCLLLQS